MKLLKTDAVKGQPLASQDRVMQLVSNGFLRGRGFHGQGGTVTLGSAKKQGRNHEFIGKVIEAVSKVDEDYGTRLNSLDRHLVDASDVAQWKKDQVALLGEQLRNARDTINTSRIKTQMLRDDLLRVPALKSDDYVNAIKESELRLSARSWTTEQRQRILLQADPEVIKALSRDPDPTSGLALSAQGIFRAVQT